MARRLIYVRRREEKARGGCQGPARVRRQRRPACSPIRCVVASFEGPASAALPRRHARSASRLLPYVRKAPSVPCRRPTRKPWSLFTTAALYAYEAGVRLQTPPPPKAPDEQPR